MGFFFYGWIFLLTFQCYHPQLKKKKKKRANVGCAVEASALVESMRAVLRCVELLTL